MSTMLEAALALAARGFAVFPLLPREKKPIHTGGFKNATRDRAQIEAWWRERPSANIGIATGPASGVWVLDLDTDHERAWALLRECGAPDTLRARSAKGWHLYFRLTHGVSIGSRARLQLEGAKVGWDVRGAGGYIVAPPSVHPSGSVYAWDADCEPQPAPDALVRLVVAKGDAKPAQAPNRTTRVRKPAAYADATIARAAQEVSEAPQGARNATLFRAAARALEVAGALEAHAPGATTRAMQQLEAAAAQAGLDPREVDATLSSAERSARPTLTLVGEPSDLPGPALEVDDRPIIRLLAETLGDAVDALEDALCRAGAIYVHGGRLSRVNGVDTLLAHGRRRVAYSADALVVQAFEAPGALLYVSSRLARFARPAKTLGEWTFTSPPTKVLSALLGKGTWPRVPLLLGIARAPFLRPDGSVAQEPGYDPSSATLLVPLREHPPIPEAPTREDARRAAEALLRPVREFPFLHPDDRAVWLAALLTLVARPAIDGPVPAFGFSANTPGTGKTLLASLAALIATGHDPATCAPTESDAETRKRLTAFVSEGTSAVLWDNVEAPFGGPSLAMLLTKTTWSDRELGESRTVNQEHRLVLLVTGQNLSTRADCARRVLTAHLEVTTPHPEDRTFEDNALEATIRSQQPVLLAHALTMLRAFVVAGRPQREGPLLGSYESWDTLVRACLAWLELGDPAGENRARARAHGDADLEALQELLRQWRRAFLGNAVTIGEATRNSQWHELLAAFQPYWGPVEALRAHRLGMALARLKGRRVVVDGAVLYFDRQSTDGDGKVRWRVLVDEA